MVKLMFLGINDVGERVYDWLTDEAEGADVLALLTEPEQLRLIHDIEPDLLVSAGFRHLVPADILDVPEMGAVNLHLSYLPYNRGMNPNVWSIVEKAPAGVSIHYMTPAFDEGPILDKRRVPVYPYDDGRDVYDRLVDAQVEQFKEVWPSLVAGELDVVEQSSEEGSYHSKEEFIELWEIDREERVTAGTLIDRLRALTFPPFKNAYFEEDGERYYVEIEITPEEEADSADGGNIPEYEE